MTPSGQTICLCMIVKNEAPVIRRCLDSVRPVIDCWLIVDTGSTDGTQDIVRAHFADLPGELVERPWRDFASNRTESLALARPHGDYSLIIDADDTLEVPDHFAMPDLMDDVYALIIEHNTIRHVRPQLVKASSPWRYEGVLHEYLERDGAWTMGQLPLVMRISDGGARRRDPETFRKDAALLRHALATDARPFSRSRYTFYLAQSYRDAGAKEEALAAYLERATMGFWSEEIFVSLYEAGKLMEALEHDPEMVIATYERATATCPTRAEAAHAASRFCRLRGYHARGYAIARPAIHLAMPADALFVEPWIYAYGIRDEFAVNAYWAGAFRECLDATLHALETGAVPAHEHPRFFKNMRFALDKLPGFDAPLVRQRPDNAIADTRRP